MINKVLGPAISKLPENNRLERIWKLAQIDFQKRYHGSWLGLIWAFLNPVFRMTIFFFVFTYFLGRGMPNFHLYLFSGMIIWMHFGQTVSRNINLLKSKKYLIENISFNKIDLFISANLSTGIGFLFNFIALLIMIVLTGLDIKIFVIYTPIIFLNLFLISLALSLILATINIFFKDIVHIWNLIMLAGFWTCPIFYTKDILLENFPIVLFLNPLSSLVINFREMVMFDFNVEWWYIIYTLGISILLLVLGILFFKKNEHLILERQ